MSMAMGENSIPSARLWYNTRILPCRTTEVTQYILIKWPVENEGWVPLKTAQGGVDARRPSDVVLAFALGLPCLLGLHNVLPSYDTPSTL
jgi:hypothetical protein